MAGTMQFAACTQISNNVKGTHKSNSEILSFMSFSTSTPKKMNTVQASACSFIKGQKVACQLPPK